MRTRYRGILGAALLGLMSMTAGAMPIGFSDLVDFGGACPDATIGSCEQLVTYAGDDFYYPGDTDEDFLQVEDDIEEFDFLHSVTFSPGADRVLWANLSVTHRGNSANDQLEAWVVKSGAGQDSQGALIGYLSFSNAIWATDTFAIPNVIIAGLNGDSWTFALRAEDEARREGNGVKLASSYLAGEYVAIPEPGTQLLIGLGLVCVMLTRVLKRR